MLARFARQVQEARAAKPAAGVHPDIHAAMIAGLIEQTRALEASIDAYESLREGQRRLIEVHSLAELPTAVIQARIARGWTQAQLADRLGMKEQQVQRYEAQRYKGVAVERLHDIAAVLGVSANVRFELLTPSASQTPEQVTAWRRASVAIVLDSVREETGRPVRGRLALQKLLLLWSEVASARLGFLVFGHRPLHYGGFDDELNDDIEVMRSAGVLTAPQSVSANALPNEDALLNRVLERTRAERQDEVYELSRAGLIWLRGFVDSDDLAGHEVKRELVRLARELAGEAGTATADGLIDRTYERFPLLAERSRIRPKVVARLRKRVARG